MITIMQYLLIFLVIVAHTYGQVATPSRELGFVYNGGKPSAKVRVDFYISPLCGDSREAWTPTLAMAAQYGPDNVQLMIYSYPLPYQQNAFYVTKAAYVMHAMTNGTKSIAWLEHILTQEISNMNDAVFHNKSDSDLLNDFSRIAASMDVNVSEFISKTDRRNKNSYEWYGRYSWKTAAARGVAATPTWFVNGVYQPQILQSWGKDDWEAFMNPLLKHHEFDFGGDSVNNIVSELGDNNGSERRSQDIFSTLLLTNIVVLITRQFVLVSS